MARSVSKRNYRKVNSMGIDPLIGTDERLDIVNEQIRLIQNKNGLTYGTDAYLLAAFTRPQPRDFAIELGGGTGIVSLLLKKTNKAKSITSVEIQPVYAELARRNFEINHFSDRLFVLCKDLRKVQPSDFPCRPGLVISNPPYLAPGSGRLNHSREEEIARHEVYGGISDFCACAGRLLSTGGKFVTVWRPERLAELLSALKDNHMEPKRMVLVCSDVDSRPCIVLTEAVKDASPALSVLPPLFLYERKSGTSQKRILTKKAQEIYDSCNFFHKKTNIKGDIK